MIKKLLNEKEKKIFDYTVRPFMIYCAVVAIIVIIGSNFSNMSSDTIDGYVCSMEIAMLINYLNMSYIEIKTWKRNKIGNSSTKWRKII